MSTISVTVAMPSGEWLSKRSNRLLTCDHGETLWSEPGPFDRFNGRVPDAAQRAAWLSEAAERHRERQGCRCVLEESGRVTA